ncbi:MAG: hypothetical protein AB1480_05200 [Nitrospirota bacterium]
MTNNTEEALDKRDQDLKNAFNQLVGDSLDALNDFINVQTMAYIMFQHETKRLSLQLGKEHPRVKQLEENTKNSLTVIRGLKVELETARISTPDVPEEGALVHGRVTDGAACGIPGLSVCAEDEKGKPLRAFGCAETNASGYYAIPIDHNTIEKLKRIDVYLTVGTTPDKVIHREKKPFTLKPNSQLIKNITLDRNTLRPTEQPMPPSPKKSREEEEKQPEREAKEKVKIDIVELKGIGPRIAEKLQRAGISDLEAFIKTDEVKLKEILGNVNVEKMKKEADALLKKASEASG